ncbi:aminoglycoside phosphotransferase family protein [Bradyrhizobium sp. MOS002]|uniref:aminoglycoside phosphotransferase family protein n=1 Tax=Bradyrhizobium sp. MOS002 TaxID=2133947 RepID=UPI000D1280CD|nr:phosphotransferase [Bradyrhizobium sp. MOS002]PSO23646.1 hypothetical protein C7G41_32430 [Bradyrhizobium sp. MOS002]
MLSKIVFFESDDRPDIVADRGRIVPELREHLQLSFGRDINLEPAIGGTLGICFDAEIASEKRFLKTHLPNMNARVSLAKEGDILQRLYGETILLDRFEASFADGTTRLFLVMCALSPLSTTIVPADAAAMMRNCRDRLGGWQLDRLATFDRYLARASCGLKTLSDRGLLDQVSATEVRRLIALLWDWLPKLPEALCHGDFGPKNIMVHGGKPRIIDWEDAFRGIAGYDYLYWLTFMENRPFLHTSAFGRTGLAPDIERAILALIVLLKSYLAVRSGAYLRHALLPQARIVEILELPL